MGSTIKNKRSEKRLSSKEFKDFDEIAEGISEFKKSSERDINPLAT